MFKCSCCSPQKSYTEERNLYRHQRKYDPSFIEPSDRNRLLYSANPKKCLSCDSVIEYGSIVNSGPSTKYCSRKCSRAHSGSGRKPNTVPSKQYTRTLSHKTPRNKGCAHCSAPTLRNCVFCSQKCFRERAVAQIKSRNGYLENTMDRM